MSTGIVQFSRFFDLPPVLQIRIFEFALSGEGTLADRRIGKRFLPIIDEVMKLQWQHLKMNPPKGPIDFNHETSSIEILSKEKRFLETGSLQEKFDYLKLFKDLHTRLKQRGAEIAKGGMKISNAHFGELQSKLHNKLIDCSLMHLWDKIYPEIHLMMVKSFDKPGLVRGWLNLPESANIRSSILRISLSDLGIRFIPIELTLFDKLQELNLSKNHIDVLPDFIGKLKHLQILNLDDNDIQEFPEDFPNWTHLKGVIVTDNPLSKRGLAQVKLLKQNLQALENSDPMDIV